MQRKIQYALFMLLFVLVWSAEGIRVQSQDAVCEADVYAVSALYPTASLFECQSLAAVACDVRTENLNEPISARIVLRLHDDLCPSLMNDCSYGQPAQTQSRALHARPADFYVFTLGRILI